MNNEKDLYEILGLSRNASDNDIKKAYKKLALKYHPDRQGGKSDSEKKEAEEKFKEISWAYSILSDAEKKQRYDQYGITDDQQQMSGGFDPSEIFKHFMGGFGSMFEDDNDPFANFFGRGRKQQNRGPEQGQSLRIQIPVSIEEIMNGVDRNIEYDIEARCDKCNGTGGEGVETCPHCHGTGMITEVRRTGFGIIQNSHPCQYCQGTGQIIKHKCSKCNGNGFVTKTVKQHIKTYAGFDNGKQLMINGAGYESKYKDGLNGDLLVILVYSFDTSKWSIQGNTIYEQIEIPYYDCILGTKLTKTLPNGDKVTINIPEYSKENTLINTGKKYGSKNYCFVVKIKMPTYIRNKERNLLQDIKKENA